MIGSVTCSYAVVENAEDLGTAQSIRIAVFVEEQGIPRELELDALDAEATHVLARTDDRAVATGRLTGQGGVAVIARIAVLPAYRGRGIGRRVVEMLEELAQHEGYAAAELSPHEYLEEFYAALGYRRVPGEEEVAGHRLIRMRKELE